MILPTNSRLTAWAVPRNSTVALKMTGSTQFKYAQVVSGYFFRAGGNMQCYFSRIKQRSTTLCFCIIEYRVFGVYYGWLFHLAYRLLWLL
ncbi:hypothetical protein Dda3937_04544 [Dickeya dadantii 3937]|uniref:Uncharacterized protein n=1 Tax=Dickeya dadantii (strain 3937) TaxID=198628 RepID=E0SL79_DICD3|nr:hypothetical protein Dda3937_04544 [Dickeya dadantii 3937]